MFIFEEEAYCNYFGMIIVEIVQSQSEESWEVYDVKAQHKNVSKFNQY